MSVLIYRSIYWACVYRKNRSVIDTGICETAGHSLKLRLNAGQSEIFTRVFTEFRLKSSVKPIESIWCFFTNVKRSYKVFWFYIRSIYWACVYRKNRSVIDTTIYETAGHGLK